VILINEGSTIHATHEIVKKAVRTSKKNKKKKIDSFIKLLCKRFFGCLCKLSGVFLSYLTKFENEVRVENHRGHRKKKKKSSTCVKICSVLPSLFFFHFSPSTTEFTLVLVISHRARHSIFPVNPR